MASHQHIRFDWAMKRLLRQKTNFAILEGFLSELLGYDVFIQQILESEGNKQRKNDKSMARDGMMRVWGDGVWLTV